ncbi:MAG TPA: response regulator [Cytophagaceae bacterium]
MENLNILFVEDDSLNQFLFQKLLKDQNFTYEIADDGKVAIEMLQSKVFHIVFMDINMPVMDGYTATKYIRANLAEPIKSIPIIAMTASDEEDEVEKYKRAGMNDYISKPFEMKDLWKKIETFVYKKVKV